MRNLIYLTIIFQHSNVFNGSAGFSDSFLGPVEFNTVQSELSKMDFWWIRKKDQLKELIVDSNQLTDECDYPYLRSLMHLSISNNQICDLDRLMDKDGFARKYIFIQFLPSKTNILANQIKLQTSFPRLQYLNINGNPVCPLLINQYESYCLINYLL